jgi:hypothetical protein
LILDNLCKSAAGPLPYNKLTPLSILKWRDAKADRPEAANSLIKALRQLYTFAVGYRHATKNPAKDVKYSEGRFGRLSFMVERGNHALRGLPSRRLEGETCTGALALHRATPVGHRVFWTAASAGRMASLHSAEKPGAQANHAGCNGSPRTPKHNRCDAIRNANVFGDRIRASLHG